MLRFLGQSSFVQSCRCLRGNTRVTVIFEVFFGIGNALCNFYLSLYMKSYGMTSSQIGVIISIGYLFGAFFSLLGGPIIDRIGRRRANTIFEIIAWPTYYLVMFFARSFWMFALGRVLNAFTYISVVAWNLMLIEDAEDEQRVAAFNLMTIIHTATGILTPIGGFIVAQYGVQRSEKGFLLFAVILMTGSMLTRYFFYRETATGERIRQYHREHPTKLSLSSLVPREALTVVFRNPAFLMVMLVSVINNMFIVSGSHLSMYYSVYINEILGIPAETVSLFGGLNAVILLVSCVLIIPRLTRSLGSETRTVAMILGGGYLGHILFCLVLLFCPEGRLSIALLAAVLYGFSYSITKTFVEFFVAKITEASPQHRAGIYSLSNVMLTGSSVVIASLAGFIYDLGGRYLYGFNILLLFSNILLLFLLVRLLNRQQAPK